MGRKLQSLEMLRAVAALSVVLYHTTTIFGTRTGTIPFAGLFASGFRGVDLFFVLSGFIIAHVHASDIGRPRHLGNYLFNRIARIYPAVWTMTMFAGSLYAIGFGGAEKTEKLAMASVAASALLLPQVGDALVNVTWTLKYELFFYLMFAVLILDLRAGLAALVLWQFATLLSSVGLLPGALEFGAYYLRSLCLDFGVGLTCAWLIYNAVFVANMQTVRRQWVLLAFGIIAFVVGMMAQTHTRAAGIPCALGAGAIVVGLILLEQSSRIQVPRILLLLGGASYAIYLVHFSAITLTAVALIRFRLAPMNDAVFLAVAALGAAAGVAFDRTVDQPIQRLLRRRLKPVLFGTKQHSHSP
jgi:exopolysaccharide production protein ExoZ